MSLTPWNNARNPWYGDYWQEIFGCVLPHNVQSTTSTGNNFNGVGNSSSNLPVCSRSLRMSQQHAGYEQDSKIQFVIDAVYAFAHAISALQRDVCGRRRPGPCPALLSYDGGDFYTKYLLNVSFLGIYIHFLFFFALLLNCCCFSFKKEMRTHSLTDRFVPLWPSILLSIYLSSSGVNERKNERVSEKAESRKGI